MIGVYDILKIKDEDFAEICDEYGFIRIGLENQDNETKLTYIVDDAEKNLSYSLMRRTGIFRDKEMVCNVVPAKTFTIEFSQSKEEFNKTFDERNFSINGEIDDNSEDPNIVDVIVKAIQSGPLVRQLDILKQVPTSLLLDTTSGAQILNAISVRDKNAKKDVLDIVDQKLSAVKMYKNASNERKTAKSGLVKEYCKKVGEAKHK